MNLNDMFDVITDKCVEEYTCMHLTIDEGSYANIFIEMASGYSESKPIPTVNDIVLICFEPLAC